MGDYVEASRIYKSGAIPNGLTKTILWLHSEELHNEEVFFKHKKAI